MCRSPKCTAGTAQVLDFSFCVEQYGSPIFPNIIGIVQITLGALMCLLVVIQFTKEAHQMYKATKHFRPNRYMKLLVREGIIYFLTYAHLSPFLLFPLPCNQAHGNRYE